MNIGGLSNLGLQAAAPKARDAKSSSLEKGDKPSFEESLGLSKSDAKPEAKTKTKERPQYEENFSEASEEVEVESLPSQPSAPSLNGPIADRALNAGPADPLLSANIAKQPGLKTQEEGVDSLTRRVVWNDFLRKMKDELGVDAEDVLKAFASLTDEELAQPPQQTVNQVVGALNLDPNQAALAKQYFSELVDKTHSKSLGEELETSHRQINLTLMSQREMQRKSLSRSLDQMNKNFFMKNPQTAKALAQMPQEVAQNQSQNQNSEASLALGSDGLMSAPAVLSMPIENIGAPVMPEAPVGSPMAALNKLNAQTKPVKASEKNTVDELVRQFLSPQAKMDTLNAGEMTAAPMTAASTVMSAAPAAPATPAVDASTAAALAASQTVSVDGLKGLLNDLGASLDGDEESDFTSDASYLNHALGGQENLKAATIAGAEFKGELAKAGAPQPMSVPELVDKAQIMLHAGGGEMKVTMSPEGLGEVAMRVTVNEGKVQVQMITESDEAKRMIERHMGELKTQLTSNNLHVENIKIDTATNLGKQLEQQYNDAQREMAHQNLAQFRQDHQGWRRSFFELPSAKLYKGQNEAPRDVQAPSVSSRKGGSRRLDLVA